MTAAGPRMRLYDANCLIGPTPWGLPGDLDVDALERRMDRFGIERSLVSHTVSWRHDPATGNDLAVRELAGHPRLRPCWVGVPSTCAEVPPAKEFAEQALQAGVGAVRVYPGDHGFALDGPDFAAHADALGEAGLPLIVDVESTSWEAVDRLLFAHPDLVVVVCGTGYRGMRQAAGLLDRHVNVRLDLSDLSTHEGFEWVCATFGSHRVVFGTGAPLRDPAEAVTRLLWSELDDYDVAQVAAGNLEALLPEAPR
ncbi:amidohydrolase family protein [Jiangella endophytica]|uniref:amidohydrolase family protein n=1 Tax=Jiangella endophytica TaxID=1623398 RepID=UPI000E341290|nr:amidohydrolase family protein [Jiangella endophytica]